VGVSVRHVSVTAIGIDRPGIVAAVTGALVDHGGNLEDTSMTILRGQFAMMLVVAVPDDVRPDELERDLSAATAGLGLTVLVRALEDAGAPPADGEAWTVSVYGADRPGIVHRMTELLAGREVNIVDLTTRVIGAADRPVYAMVLEVVLPAGLSSEAIGAELRELAAELGVECSLHPAEADIL
jgi:glycine cleavage system transcriptional repressor